MRSVAGLVHIVTMPVDFIMTHRLLLRFTGKERDSESGLDYFGARYNGSTMGRFMTPDPLGGKLVDPQTLNRYSYVINNPLRFTDPTGLYTCKDDNNQCKTRLDKLT
jgi:RHS repeat-associated protein